MSTFSYQSVMPGPAADVFGWHERPDAILDLIPLRRFVRIERQAGGLLDGGSVMFSVGIGPVRMRWEARHYGYVRGRQFCDEQIRGPFKVWRHTHRVEPIDDGQSLYEDRIEYTVPGGRLAQGIAEPVVRWMLTRAFAHRHQVVRTAMAEAGRTMPRRHL